jgi:hypothetical protein
MSDRSLEAEYSEWKPELASQQTLATPSCRSLETRRNGWNSFGSDPQAQSVMALK